MFTMFRALSYASIFIAVMLVFVPARLLQQTGVTRPASLGPLHVFGGVLVVIGSALALSCVLTFALIGRGTPAPFDPPRRLVIRGPYRALRNPMYLGAVVALLGAALFFGSTAILAYAAVFFVATHLFVISYEEPALRRAFGEEYDEYVRRVRRWWPRSFTS